MTKYKVIFAGTKGEVSLFVDSPLEVNCENEQNVHAIIDVTIDLAKHLLGKDFQENLDVFCISLDLADKSEIYGEDEEYEDYEDEINF